MEENKQELSNVAGLLLFVCIIFVCFFAITLKEEDESKKNTTEITVEHRKGKVNQDKVPEYYQWDNRWRKQKYANGTMANSGCGPTCLSMVLVYFTRDEKKTPDWVADYSTKHKYIIAGKTAWTLMSEGATKLGLQVKEISTNEKKIDKEIKKGRLLICSVGPGDFTKGGHFIVITGKKKKGYTIKDPNNEWNSKQTWKYKRISSQIKNIWSYW